MPTPLQQTVAVEKNWRQFKGLLPAFDPRNVDQPHIIDGRNFALDTKGPYAAFGNRIANYQQLVDASIVQTIRIEDDNLLFVNGAVFKFDTTTQHYVLQYLFDDAGDVWPWSVAFVGGLYYFCRKGVGVFEYDADTNTWTEITSYVPDDPRACCEAVGRLIIVGETQIAWSTRDDGSDLVPSLVTGAGFEFISGYISGTGLGVKTASDGFYTFTNKGFFKSEYNFVFGTNSSPFRHYPLDGSRTYAPLNQWCLISIDDVQHVFLDKQGFFSLQKNTITPYTVGFSEWLRKSAFPNLDLTNTQLLRLTYSQKQNMIFLSVSDGAKDYLYGYAFAYYIPLEEWGRFDRVHYSIIETYYSTGPNSGYAAGYIDGDGLTRRFVIDPFNEINPADAGETWDVFYWTPISNPPMWTDTNGQLHGISEFHMSSYPFTTVMNLAAGNYEIVTLTFDTEPAIPTQIAYDDDEVVIWQTQGNEDFNTSVLPNEDWNALTGTDDYGTSTGADSEFFTLGAEGGSWAEIKYPIAYQAVSDPLNSWIRVGMASLTDNSNPDLMSRITDVVMGFDSADANPTNDDYLDTNYSPDVVLDWNAGSGGEDWGTSVFEMLDFNFTVYGTLDDGTNIFMQADPVLYKDGGAMREYKCDVNGLYHFFELRAEEVNQSFHLHLLRYGNMLSGRL